MKSYLTIADVMASPGGMITTGQTIAVTCESAPVHYYQHGWQSWSLAAWVNANYQKKPPRPAILHPLQTDPVYVHETNPHGSWMGAIDTGKENILLLGSLVLEAHVRLDENILRGWVEVGEGEWFIAHGPEKDVFAQYAAHLGRRFGYSRIAQNPRVWCSWYSLYKQITEEALLSILKELGGLPFDVFQIDDGWQLTIGDWEPNRKFPSGMASLANHIYRTGRTPGLWLAPLLVVPSSALYRQHSDWLLRDETGKSVSAGFNWREQLYALDVTHPEILDWLAALMHKVVHEWGYHYVKLDFMYAGALPGVRHTDIPRETAYRQALQVIREALDDAFLLTCGAPIIPSLGLCDALRIGPDVASHWQSRMDDRWLRNPAIPGARNAVRTTVNRLWLSSLLLTDPDVAYFATQNTTMTSEQQQMLQNLAHISGFKATSDLPSMLTPQEQDSLRHFLEWEPDIQSAGRYRYSMDGNDIDFSSVMKPDPVPSVLDQWIGAFIGSMANFPFILKLNDTLTNRSIAKNLE